MEGQGTVGVARQGRERMVMGTDEIYAKAAAQAGAEVGYAGTITVEEAWRLLADDPDAVLVDVRTKAEWTYVGVPDLSDLGKETVLVQWKAFPSMVDNAEFAGELVAMGVTSDKAALLMCRTQVRSAQAATALAARGYPRCYVVDGGFEGQPDEQKHRGSRDGWKAAGLPWVQG
jgi:rhodanese-related sulfurtransferase